SKLLDSAFHFRAKRVCYRDDPDECPFPLDEEERFPFSFKSKRGKNSCLLLNHPSVADGHLHTIDTRTNPHPWNGFKLRNPLKRQSCGLSFLADCLGQRMLGVSFSTCCEQKHVFGGRACQ